MKKICKRCGRNRRIGRFGKDKNTSDGKRIYCRDCISAFNKRYKNSNNGFIKCRNTIDKWKNSNEDHIREYNKEYYKKNKRRILYNQKAKKETECILIMENPKKNDKHKINKSRKKYNIIIDPKRKN